MADTKQTKLTNEELATVKAIPTRLQQITIQLGQIAVERATLERRTAEIDVREDQLKTDLVMVQQQERTVANELTNRYGAGTINPETGIFIPKSQENIA